MSTEYVEASGIGATYELMESISKMREEQCMKLLKTAKKLVRCT